MLEKPGALGYTVIVKSLSFIVLQIVPDVSTSGFFCHHNGNSPVNLQNKSYYASGICPERKKNMTVYKKHEIAKGILEIQEWVNGVHTRTSRPIDLRWERPYKIQGSKRIFLDEVDRDLLPSEVSFSWFLLPQDNALSEYLIWEEVDRAEMEAGAYLI